MDQGISDFIAAENPNNSSMENTKGIGKPQQPTPLSTQNDRRSQHYTPWSPQNAAKKTQQPSPHIVCVCVCVCV